MSKKHLEDMTRRLRVTRPTDEDKVTRDMKMEQWERMVHVMADLCATHCERFNRQRFLNACGMEV